MDPLTIFAVIAAIIILGYFAELLFKKTGIPDVLILIIIGISLRYFFEAVHPENLGSGASLFAIFTLIYLLFQGALAIDFNTLFGSLKEASILTIISFIFSALVTSFISFFILGFDLNLSLLLGLILGGVSSAVVIPLVNMLPLEKKYATTLTLESAITDVLCIVGAMTMIKIIISGQISGTQIFRDIITSFSLALVIGAFFGLIWVFTLFKFKNLRRAHLVTIAVIIALYAFVESPLVAANGAIAALSFGLILGNSSNILSINKNRTDEDKSEIKDVLSTTAQSFFSEISFFVKVFFFVYLGILMDFSNPIIFAYAGIVVLGIYLIRPLSVWLSYDKNELDDYSRTSLEVLIPKGLAAAVLANISIQEGVQGASEMSSLIMAVILISITLTSILVPLSKNGYFKGFFYLFSRKSEIKKVPDINIGNDDHDFEEKEE